MEHRPGHVCLRRFLLGAGGVSLLVAGLWWLAGCGSPTPGAPNAGAGSAALTAPPPAAATALPAAAQPPRRVRINIPALAATFIQHYIARDEGFFTRHGVEAEISVIPAVLGLQAMIAGDFDFSGAVGTTVSAALTNVPVRVVLINTDRPLSWLYARPEIRSLLDLKGKTVAISAPGALDDANTRQMLRTAGVDPAEEVTFLQIGAADQRLQPLLAGAVDAAVLAMPANVLARRAGMTELAFYGERLRGAFTGLSATTQTIEERRDLVKATIAAILEAVDFYNRHPAEAKLHLQETLELEPELVDGIYESVKLGWTTDGTMSEDAMRDNIRSAAAAATEADASTDPGAVFDFSLAREVVGEGQPR
jgi:NitT/TauT family transport system substrate-binding protein